MTETKQIVLPNSSTPGVDGAITSTPEQSFSQGSNYEAATPQLPAEKNELISWLKGYAGAIVGACGIVALILIYYFTDMAALRSDLSKISERMAVTESQLAVMKEKISQLESQNKQFEELKIKMAVIEEKQVNNQPSNQLK